MREKSLKSIYNDLSKIVDRDMKLSNKSLRNAYYDFCLKSSFVKLVEFNEFIHSTRKYEFSFFYLATLRGICEDLIVLTFLSKFHKRDRNKLILMLAAKQWGESIKAQTIFFTRNRPRQWVIMHTRDKTEKDLANLSNETKKLKKKLGLGARAKLPSVKQMAAYSGMSDLYDYLYHATSKVVHFSPHVLMRMGWGDLEKGPFVVSTKNFYPYYRAFNEFYGSFLFIKYVDEFQKYLHLSQRIIEYRDVIERVIGKKKRWPELVTFEEMNLDLDKFDVFMPTAVNIVMAQDDYSIDKS